MAPGCGLQYRKYLGSYLTISFQLAIKQKAENMKNGRQTPYHTKIKPVKNPKTPVEKLIKYRFDNRMTYIALSRKLNVSDALLKGIVYGVNNMTPYFAIKLAKYIGADQKEFLVWSLTQYGAWNKKWELIERRKNATRRIDEVNKLSERCS